MQLYAKRVITVQWSGIPLQCYAPLETPLYLMCPPGPYMWVHLSQIQQTINPTSLKESVAQRNVQYHISNMTVTAEAVGFYCS